MSDKITIMAELSIDSANFFHKYLINAMDNDKVTTDIIKELSIIRSELNYQTIKVIMEKMEREIRDEILNSANGVS